MPKVKKVQPQEEQNEKEVKAKIAPSVPRSSQIVFPKLASKWHTGADALTEDQIKKMFGWQTETDEVKFGSDYLFVDEEDRKVRCTRVPVNRPFDKDFALQIAQDLLNSGPGLPEAQRKWRLNGESMTISNKGNILNGQKRGAALVFACQRYRSEAQKNHWKEIWPTAPTLEILVAYGIDEDQETIATIDNTQARTTADSLFTADYWAHVPYQDRKYPVKVADAAIRMLWLRTGMGDTEFNPYHEYETSGETLDFLKRHEKLVDIVNHIVKEDENGAISKYLSPGYAAAIFYMMASSTSDIDDYRNADPPSEKLLNFDREDQAKEFWVLLGSKSPNMAAVVNAKHPSGGYKGSIDWSDVFVKGGGAGKLAERLTVIARAWALFVKGYDIKKSDLLKIDDYDISYLDPDPLTKKQAAEIVFSAKLPSVGGIDLGEAETAEGEEVTKESLPTPEEIARRSNEEKARREEIKKRLLENRRNGKANGKKPLPKSAKLKTGKDGKVIPVPRSPVPKLLKNPKNKRIASVPVSEPIRSDIGDDDSDPSYRQAEEEAAGDVLPEE